MKDKTKRNLALLGISVMCVALVVGIGMRFQAPPPREDAPLPASSSTPEANPQPIEAESKVSPKSIDVSGADTSNTENKGGSSAPAGQVSDQTDQTEQQIQPNVVKPTPPPKDALPASSSAPEIVDHDAVTTPPPKSSSGGGAQHGDTKDGMIYVDGFGWIKDEGGGGQGSTVGSEGDELTGNKVGEMG